MTPSLMGSGSSGTWKKIDSNIGCMIKHTISQITFAITSMIAARLFSICELITEWRQVNAEQSKYTQRGQQKRALQFHTIMMIAVVKPSYESSSTFHRRQKSNSFGQNLPPLPCLRCLILSMNTWTKIANINVVSFKKMLMSVFGSKRSRLPRF